MTFWRVVLILVLICVNITKGAISRHTGPCVHKGILFTPGQTFYKGCDKCYCHENGFVCLSPMKPTSWPKKCERVPRECGYRVVYRDNNELDCRPYSWVW